MSPKTSSDFYSQCVDSEAVNLQEFAHSDFDPSTFTWPTQLQLATCLEAQRPPSIWPPLNLIPSPNCSPLPYLALVCFASPLAQIVALLYIYILGRLYGDWSAQHWLISNSPHTNTESSLHVRSRTILPWIHFESVPETHHFFNNDD